MTRRTADSERSVGGVIIDTEIDTVPGAHVIVRGFTEETIDVEDAGVIQQRSFLIHMPTNPGLTQMPAVIAFHGGGQDADAMAAHWVFVGDADLEVVVVCPQALVDPTVNETRWEIPTPNSPALPTIDLSFVDALLQYLTDTGAIDPDQVYATGFSNGAGMTSVLALHDDYVNRFRGFAPVSQAANSAMLALAGPVALATSRPLCYIHGTADPNWSQVYNNVQEPMPHDMVSDWLERNHSLPAESVVVYNCPSVEPTDPTIGVFAVEQLYPEDPNVADSAAVCRIVVINGAHAYPLTGRQPAGLVSRDFNASARILEFWSSHAGLVTTSLTNWRQC